MCVCFCVCVCLSLSPSLFPLSVRVVDTWRSVLLKASNYTQNWNGKEKTPRASNVLTCTWRPVNIHRTETVANELTFVGVVRKWVKVRWKKERQLRHKKKQKVSSTPLPRASRACTKPSRLLKDCRKSQHCQKCAL